MKYILALILLITCVSLACEVRAMWVLPWDIANQEVIDTMIETALQSNQTELLVEVRYRSDALYDTSIAAGVYPNPEPRSYILANDGFDPLRYILDEAHSCGLKVQAWVIVFNATPLESKLLAKNYMYSNHRNWLTCDKNGSTLNGNTQFGYFIDPGVPEVQDYLISVFSNLVAGYPDLDGLHLDYIRYPDMRLGYNPISVKRYEEYCAQNEEITFNEWRIMQVSTFVKRLNWRVKEINPKLILSAAVFSDIAEANVAYAQDWTNWLKEGYIDRVYPMAYNTKYSVYTKQLEQMKLLGKDESIVMGLRAWDEGGRSLVQNGSASYKVADIAKRIDLARELGFGGVAMFSYAGLKVGNAWQQLTRMSFETMPESSEPVVESSPLLIQEPIVEVTLQDEAKEKMEITTLDSQAVSKDKAVNFTALKALMEYQIELEVPSEGKWRWEIWKDNKLYSRYRYYLEGRNKDYWDGVISAGESVESTDFIVPGEYTVRLTKEDSGESYSIPVTFEEIFRL